MPSRACGLSPDYWPAASRAPASTSTGGSTQIEIDGTYVLTSAARHQVALILPGETHTAFTGRLLHLLRNGVPGGPELLTVGYLYRQLVMKMKAEGLSQPQRRGTFTADLLALAGNRAFADAGSRQHLQEPTSTIADTPTPAARYDFLTLDQAAANVPFDDSSSMAKLVRRRARRRGPGTWSGRWPTASPRTGLSGSGADKLGREAEAAPGSA